ncbi:MAG: BREX system P-loop protein BrxC, partial [bacterium]|nr:BREX system P-loop protein BrxC [bacterium]
FGRPELPRALAGLGKVLESCLRTRQVEEIVFAVKSNLDALRDGFEQLAIYLSDLDERAIAAVIAAAAVRDHQLRQLGQRQLADGVAAAAAAVQDHLASDRPWRAITSLEPALASIVAGYREERRHLLSQQAIAVEEAAGRIMIREGFEQLDPDRAHRILGPLNQVIDDTTEEAL